MKNLEEKAYQLLITNRRFANSHLYTVPSPTAYPHQWLWDSCFHAIVLRHFDVGAAQAQLLSLVSKQLPSGLIPHMIYWTKSKVLRLDWGVKNTSAITQPPLIAYAAWKIYEKSQDKKFLEAIFPALEKYYNYLLTQRDPHTKHLIGIINPDESGEDNSPRFDIPLNLPAQHEMSLGTRKRRGLMRKNRSCNFDAAHCMKLYFWVKDVPFNTFLVSNLTFLAKIAKTLGKKHEASFFIAKRDLTIAAMKKLMFEDGIYWSTYGPEYKKIKVKTWAIFAPLFAKILNQKEAENLVEKHLLDKNQFWLKYPVPTVSANEPSFNPSGFWRGPTWIATNWFIFKGLQDYGFDDLAKKIRKTSIDLVENQGFFEYFNPETGQGLGARDFTWGTLVVDMIKTKIG